MSTNPQVGTFIFLEGQGAPQKQCYASMVMQNPGGGGLAAVLVPARSRPYAAQLRGTFPAVPDFRSLIGSIITYIKDGVNVQAYVDQADLQQTHWVNDPVHGAVLMCTGAFILYPLA